MPAIDRIDPNVPGLDRSLAVRRPHRNIGTRIFGGRTEYPYAQASGGVAGARTWSVRTVAAVPSFMAMRIIIGVAQTAGNDAITPSLQCVGASLPDRSDASIAAANYVSFTWNGAGPTTVPPSAGAGRRNLMFSDWTPIVSVPRTDGGVLPIVDLQAMTYTSGTAGTVVMFGNSAGTDSYANWAGRADADRPWSIRTRAGTYAAPNTGNQMTAAATVAANYCPIVGFQYLTESGVVTILNFGDSIDEGRGTFLAETHVLMAAVARQAATGIPHEVVNLAWAAQTPAQIRRNIVDAMAQGVRGDVAFMPSFTPNGTAASAGNPSPITPTEISAMRGNLGVGASALREQGIPTVFRTGTPADPSVKPWGASDSLRVAANDLTKSTAGFGGLVLDLAAVINGVLDGNGQRLAAPGLLGDGIHPSTLGYSGAVADTLAVLDRVVPVISSRAA